MSYSGHICGCYVLQAAEEVWARPTRHYLPQLELAAHTTIHAAAFSTKLTQKYTNPGSETLKELRYTFPLYDGVSVVGFEFKIQDRFITGIVKEKEQAKAIYDDAVQRGETAGLLEQSPNAADVFSTTIGNIPPLTDVHVTIDYVGELKHDAEVDGIRFTIPTAIAPRYGSYPGELLGSSMSKSGMRITVDASLPENSTIQKLLSPSHPIAVSIGVLSSTPDADMSPNMGSATLALESAELDKDFVLQLVAKDSGIPRAMLESHPTLDGHRALMTTLVPKFSLKPTKPELIFVADRSGSMDGSPITTLKSALQVFLKSLPVGVKFNICSFGSGHELLWSESTSYSQTSLDEASKYVKKFSANFGGTETFGALKATLDSRRADMPTEIMLLTDGDIARQYQVFEYLNQEVGKSNGQLRVFAIGIGGGVSSALIEGVARAGNGFSQLVGNGERLEGKLVRMLKGALTPHLQDCELQVKYHDDADDFEIIERMSDSLTIEDLGSGDTAQDNPDNDTPMSLYDPEATGEGTGTTEGRADRFAHLPHVPGPKLMQVPSKLPPLFPFSRMYAYLLLSPEKKHLRPESVVLKATSSQGPLELEIKIDQKVQSGRLFHQLAARRAMQELEEGRGWIDDVKSNDGKLLSETHPSWQDELREREAIRIGVEYQVAGKYCSFVAVEGYKTEHVTGDQPAPVEKETVRRGCMPLLMDYSVSDEDVDIGVFRNSSSPPKRQRRGGPARVSTSGKPPRMQLASKAAQPPRQTGGGGGGHGGGDSSSSDPYASLRGTLRGGGGGGEGGATRFSDTADTGASTSGGRGGYKGSRGGVGRGIGRGAAMRHRKISITSDDTEDSVERGEHEEMLLLARLISAQSFEGFWLPGSVPWDDMGMKLKTVVDSAEELTDKAMPWSPDLAPQLLASMCVLFYLERKMGNQKDEWELVVEKGKEWVMREAGLENDAPAVDENEDFGVVGDVAGKIVDGSIT
ncbi:MAG: hypothetical protein M1831_004474 [Alyxoria varia]|nr:MAG: hypothetical protein M1831_004474 [Alyxoria varia]